MKQKVGTAVVAAALGAAAGSQIGGNGSSGNQTVIAPQGTICKTTPTTERFEAGGAWNWLASDAGTCVLLRGQIHKVIAVQDGTAIVVPISLK